MAKLTDEYIQARIAGNDKVEKAYIDANGDAVIFAADGFGWDCGDMPLATIDLIPTAKGAKHFNLSLDLLRPIAAAEVAEMTEEEMQKYQDDCEGDAKAQTMKEENDDA